MVFFRFKTFKCTYYFPELTAENRFIYSLYGNYGGKGAHLVWWLFCHSAPLRWLWRVRGEEIEGLPLLQSLLGDDVVFGVNMGTKGPDQKTSVLGYYYNVNDNFNLNANANHNDNYNHNDNVNLNVNDKLNTDRRFFAKLATTERAKALTRNEIKVYQTLAGTGLVPELYDYKDTEEYVFLKCECISGEHVRGDVDKNQIMAMLKCLKAQHYDLCITSQENTTDGLKTCFAHMDFCPWNMIDVDGKLRIIDWEMAAEMPLGFDLFTYLLQTFFLTDNSKTGMEVIEQHREWIEEYFEGEDWHQYLKAFIDYKVDFFSAGQNPLLLSRFTEMAEVIKD